MSVVLVGAPWVLVAWALVLSGLFRAQRDEIVGLLGSAPWLLLGLALMLLSALGLVEVAALVTHLPMSPSVKLEIASLASAAICCERVLALRRGR